MSAAKTTTESCASCGIAEVDVVKLTKCDGCDLVRYCSDECEKDHRPEHCEAKCKQRAAELREEILFKQPEGTHLGDCPICCLPLPLDPYSRNRVQPCCTKVICDGCSHANALRHLQEKIQLTCPFCRHPAAETREEVEKNKMKRIAANDPVAISRMGCMRCQEGDYDAALKYFTKAAELGDVVAHYELSVMYRKGEGVEKDNKKAIYHLEEAAIGGHPNARYNLGVYEARKGNHERAVKHYIMAANLGLDSAIQALKEHYKHGDVSKDDFAAALRAHHAAVVATKSPQREAAAKHYTSRHK